MNTRGRVGEEWIFGVPSTTTLRGTLLYLRGHRHANIWCTFDNYPKREPFEATVAHLCE